MKRLLLLGLAVLIVTACSLFLKPSAPWVPGTITLEAQTLPITKTLAWDANPASDAVTNYVVRLDGVIIGSPVTTTQLFTITTLGSHTLAVRAVNLWGESVDTTLTVNVVLPAKPTGLRLQ